MPGDAGEEIQFFINHFEGIFCLFELCDIMDCFNRPDEISLGIIERSSTNRNILATEIGLPDPEICTDDISGPSDMGVE